MAIKKLAGSKYYNEAALDPQFIAEGGSMN
jgi:hypothetical protein